MRSRAAGDGFAIEQHQRVVLRTLQHGAIPSREAHVATGRAHRVAEEKQRVVDAGALNAEDPVDDGRRQGDAPAAAAI